MMVATLADGTTTIEQAAREPEVVDLARALSAMGAKITGAGEDVITIEGVPALHGVDFTIVPDRIEAGTFMMAAAMTGGDVYVRGARAEHLHAVILKLREAGVDVQEDADGIRVIGNGRLRSVDVKTMPYPGFPTDLQAQMMAALSLADGRSVISETIFENRFMHVLELNRMGADVKVEGNSAIVRGVATLSGAPVMATDLRASVCLVLAGLGRRRRDRGVACLPPRSRLRADRREAVGVGCRHPSRQGAQRVGRCSSAYCPREIATSRSSSQRIRERGAGGSVQVETQARRIVDAVRRRGDRAVIEFTRRFDGVTLSPAQLRVSDAGDRRGAGRGAAGGAARAAPRGTAHRRLSPPAADALVELPRRRPVCGSVSRSRRCSASVSTCPAGTRRIRRRC